MVQHTQTPSHISRFTGRPRRTKRFGNKATIANRPNALIYGPNRSDRVVNPAVVAQIKDELWSRSITTIDRWSEQQGSGADAYAGKLVQPLISVHYDDRAIYMDLVCEVVPADVGLRWYVEGFNTAAFRRNFERAIDMACTWFAEAQHNKQWNHIVVANEQSVSEARSVAR